MQRSRLLFAMGEVVAERGLQDVSIGLICKRAGVSRRTFYELFEDREECVLATFDDAVARIIKRIDPLYAGPGTWRERLRHALAALLDQLDAEPRVARFCIVETLKAGPTVVERRGEVFAGLVAAIEADGRVAGFSAGPPPLTAQGVVGGALSVVYMRLLESTSGIETPHLTELTGALVGLIVHPYLGSAVARQEVERRPSKRGISAASSPRDPFEGLSIRFTYRTARVLATIADDPGASNRVVADGSGIGDEGQMSRLLSRLQRSGLIENGGEGQPKGEANAWKLTGRGDAVHAALAGRAAV